MGNYKLHSTDLSPLEKASIVLDEVEQNISGTDTMEKFNKLCEILKNGGGAINECVKNLAREIGLLYIPGEQVSYWFLH